MDLNNTSAVVCGGAGGFGEATVRRLVDAGAYVVIADLAEEKGKALEAELGGRARFVATDVTSVDSVQESIRAAASEGPLRSTVIVHGGSASGKRILNRAGETYSIEVFRKTVDIFLTGTFNVMSQAAVVIGKTDPAASGQRGVIVTTASIAGFEGAVGQTDYSAAKGGVIGMTLTAARDLAPVGIRVMGIAPGTFFTPAFKMSEEDAQAKFGVTVPNPKRMGHVNEYARLAQDIIENDYLNGTVIRIDGALRFNA